jgi:hypothetical protein
LRDRSAAIAAADPFLPSSEFALPWLAMCHASMALS